jgi:hypothetical protein
MRCANVAMQDLTEQPDLFAEVLHAYAGTTGDVHNVDLYRCVGERAKLEKACLEARVPIGRSGERHSPVKRRIRWYQQTLKTLGLLENGELRGTWRLTPAGKKKLTQAPPRRVLIGFSTDLGVALWGCAEDVFARIDEPITLCLTSPPYPLAIPRAYGNPTPGEYVDWLCRVMEPIVRNLAPGGSICLNVGSDVFEPGSPARSLYRARLLIALNERLGLSLMDELVYHNPAARPVRSNGRVSSACT